MTFVGSQCCAYRMIEGLAYHAGNMHGAMKSFCEQQLRIVNTGAGPVLSSPSYLYSFYVFSCPCNKDGEFARYNYSTGVSKFGPTYGTEFAKYIVDNGLGTVAESAIMQNIAFHSDHYNQIWTWAVDQEAVKAWWLKENSNYDVNVGAGRWTPTRKGSTT